jgi:hypothetical protein
MTAETSAIRITVASSSTAMARPNPRTCITEHASERERAEYADHDERS